MSKSRQACIRSLSVRFSPGHCVEWHRHDWAQLIYATEGAMTVATELARWVVPTRRAIWVPAGQQHEVEMHGRVLMRTVYLPAKRRNDRFKDCAVVSINSLQHELIQLVCDRGIIHSDSIQDRTLIRFFQHQLDELKILDSALKMPTDPRAQQFSKRILANPGNSQSLGTLAAESGTSLRTLQRLFPQEVGMSVSRWRHRVRMMRAVEMLGQGEAVTNIAMCLGFESLSAFIHSFKQCFGQTPGRYSG